jgi:hypothetical protein
MEQDGVVSVSTLKTFYHAEEDEDFDFYSHNIVAKIVLKVFNSFQLFILGFLFQRLDV